MTEHKKYNTYRAARKEAERFIEKAELAIKAIEAEEYYHGGQHTAAAKRSSMDLTRALAALRRV